MLSEEDFKRLFPNLAREIEEKRMCLTLVDERREVERRLLESGSREEALKNLDKMLEDGIISEDDYKLLREAVELGLIVPESEEERKCDEV